MNVIARLEFELAYYDSAVHRFNHYATRTPPSKNWEYTYEEPKWLSEKTIHDITNFDNPSNSWRCTCKKILRQQYCLLTFPRPLTPYTEKQILPNGLPKETVAAIMMLYRNMKVKVCSPDGDTDNFDIVTGVLQGDTLAPYLFVICLDYLLRERLLIKWKTTVSSW